MERLRASLTCSRRDSGRIGACTPIVGERTLTPLPMLISTARIVPVWVAGTAFVACAVLTVVT